MRDDKKPKKQLISELVELRQRVEESSLEPDERYRLLMESTDTGVNLLDKDGHFLLVNRVAAGLIGKEPEAMIGRDFRDLMPAELVDKSEAKFNRVMETGIGETHEEFLERLNTYVMESAQPVMNAAGEIVGVQVMTYDITERKRMEEALRESEERYRSIFEGASDAIFTLRMTDEGPRFADFNTNALDLYGCTREELLSASPLDFSPSIQPDGRSSAEKVAEIEVGAMAGEPQFFEWRHCRLDGTLFDAEVAVCLVDLGGERHLQAIVRDITERKQAQEALRESEERNRALVEGCPDFIIEVDREARILYVNRVAPELNMEDVLKLKAYDFVLPEYHGEYEAKLESVFTGGTTEAIETRRIDENGRLAHYQTRMVPLKAEGQILSALLIVTDITEPKRAEEALRESEGKLRIIFENVNDEIVQVDASGTIIDVNDRVEDIFGYKREEVLGRNIAEFNYVGPDGLQTVMDDFASGIKGEALPLKTYEMLRKDGSRVFVELSGRPSQLGGEVGTLLVIVREVTARKETEEALRRSEERYRLLAENVTDVIWTGDMNVRTTYISPSITLQRGYTVDEAMAQTIHDMMPPDHAESMMQAFAEGLAADEAGQGPADGRRKVEVELYCKDGSTIWAEVHGVWLRDSEENIVGILGVTRDITERKLMEEELRNHREHLEQLVEKRTIELAALNKKLQEDIAERKRSEEALRESEEILRSTIASMDDLVFLLDREGSFLDHYQPLKTADLYLPPEAFVGKSFKEVVPPDVATSLEAAVDGVMATGAVQRFEYSMRISGKERWFSATVSMRTDVSGDFAGVTVVVRDITDRKRSEEATRRDAKRRRALTTRLAEAEETERKRVSQELHDQVGPNLTALGINLNMMLSQITDRATNPLVPRLTDSVALVEQTAECIRNLMADLRPPVLDDYGLFAAVRWYGDQLTSRAGIAVTVEGEDVNPRLPPTVETSVFRIIQEALTNVMKHAQVAQVNVALQPKNETLRLTITDEGAGFDCSQPAGPDERPGWGLMTMAERAEAMGARFSINSRPGHGTDIVLEVDR